MRHLKLLTAAVAAALLLSGCVTIDFGPSERFTADFHYSYDLQPGGRVDLENINGAVEIAGWDQNKAEITGARFASTREGLDSVRIDMHNSPDSLNIRTEVPSLSHAHAGARYSIRLPRGAVLDHIATSNGQIRVKDLSSGAHLRTTNGAIRVENLGGSLIAQTTNGPVELNGVGGGVSVRTTNGRVRAEEIVGECEVKTSNGGITIHLGHAPGSPASGTGSAAVVQAAALDSAPVKATTSNGSIEVTLEHAPKSGIRAETSNGAITVRLPADTAARIEAITSNSSIRSDFETPGSGPETNGSRNHLNATIGSGGPLIDLSTRNGHISVLRF